MANNYAKMRSTNGEIKQKLVELGFTDIHLFPHGRFSKDYTLEEMDFDGMAWKNGNPNEYKKLIYFFQLKSNRKPSKKDLANYKTIEEKCFCKCVWISKFNRNGIYWFDWKTGLKGIKL
ncbi:MAG: hypothetical protein ACOCV1_01575 [Bacillota bacterium]